MFISLYTSRVILNVLGVEDFGIFNVVVGFVAIFSLLSESFGSAFSRYLTVSIANGDINKQKEIFTTSLNILLIFTAVIIILGEFLGIYYFSNVANIPSARKGIIQIIFQFALLTFISNMLKVCCTSMLIAYEKTNVYGIFSIIDSFLKLVIVYLISRSPFDKLVTYVFLLLIVSILSTLMNGIYCKIKFSCFSYQKNITKSYYKEMSTYATWNFLGLLSYVLSAQGLTLLINGFVGVICNAARGIATQVDGATRQFVYSFLMAINPQIIKSYTTKDYSYVEKMLFFSSKCSCYVMFFYAIPLVCDTNIILKIWLNTVPPNTVIFVRLTLLATVFVFMAKPFEAALQATGKLRDIQILTLGLSVLSLLFSWLLLYNNFSVYFVYAIYVVYSFSILLSQLICFKKYMNFSLMQYFKKVFLRTLIVMLVSMIMPLYIIFVLPESLWRLFLIVIASSFNTLIIELLFGFSKNERVAVVSNIKKY